MHDFSMFHLIATAACIVLAIWLRIRLFGKLESVDEMSIVTESEAIDHDHDVIGPQATAQAASAQP